MADARPIVVVFTATSNTGSATVKYLVEHCSDKVKVRAVVRKRKQMAEIQAQFGADVEVVNGDITQPALLKAVFANDINTAFWATPTSPNRAELTGKFLDACIDNGVDFPIIISVLGADVRATAFQRQMADAEALCAAKQGTPVKRQMLDTGSQTLQPIILRCGLFYQNMFGMLPGIEEGTLYYPLGDGELAHVDLADVGKCAATILSNAEPHGGKTYNLIGERQAGRQIVGAVNMNTAVRTCKYTDVDDETAAYAFTVLGLPQWIAEGNVETLRWMRTGGAESTASDVEAITGDQPTKFSQFVKKNLSPLLQ